MNEVQTTSYKSFDSIKHIDDAGREFWLARELQQVLGYTQWRNFENAIDRAKTACINSGIDVSSHFADVSKMVNLGVGTERRIQDIALSRYACYLIVQNGDPRKEIIAHGQTYFAIQTRRQEISDTRQTLTEEEKRVTIRHELAEHNKSLAEAAKMAGIVDPRDYAIFQNKGYQGLYGGLSMHDIHARKGLKKSEKILDFMGSTELAANLFRATQADEKIRRENVRGRDKANQVHYDVGVTVRNTIKQLGGRMPENLPTPHKSIKQIEREQKQKQLPKK